MFKNQLLGRMSAAERAAGRYMRGPDGHHLDLKALGEHFDRHHGEVKGLIEETKEKLRLHDELISDVAQKMARSDGGGGRAAPEKSLGAQFVESESFKALAESPGSRKGRADLRVKATITSATADAAGSAGAATAQNYRDNNVLLPQQRLVVRDLLPVINVSSGAVEYARQKARTNNAGMVAEGAAKPGSDLQFELKTTNAKVIAHWMKASRQVLDDAPQLRGLIDTDLIYGLKLKEEGQILLGDGTGQNLHGLVPQATAYSAPFTVDGSTMIDQVGLALLQSALALYPANGIVLNDADWMRMKLEKDGAGRYILGPPGAMAQPMLWGVPVVTTPAMTVDKFLVGDFQAAATLYDRWEARVEVATENEDDFIKNLLTILAEERVALAVKQPLALTYGDFGNVG